MSCHGREWPKNLAIAFREFHGWANDFHAVHIPLTLEGCTEREEGSSESLRAWLSFLLLHYSSSSASNSSISAFDYVAHSMCSTTYECHGGAACCMCCVLVFNGLTLFPLQQLQQ